jgi:transformation/transcription domain-associated protein
LRNLPVPEQIATIETFTFISKQDPKLLPLSENLVLVFFSELLKMMSVADGEMNSESISNAVIVNKDGYNPNAAKQRNNCMIHPHSSLSHASGLFFRDEYSMYVDGIGRINVPSEIPAGIQVRVSSLILFHTVLKTHSELFFSSEPTSSIGNILPHIVSLLFRSLTSRPEQAVDAAYAGLRDILSLSAKPKDGENSHRLPKNLLQMCIRPVLLNLRDYTKLSIPLLRGLSRLLSLLSSWFSKTLGEKLLEHLQRWTDPDKIMELECWKKGDEPLVAAAIIELFELLPDDSHFVELLVKTTLKLENALPRYKNYCLIESPFRLPLAKYLSKHGEATAMFFVNEHRLKNPLYSDLLQDIIKRPESSVLRNKLSEKKWSNVLLNVCFERPLFIMRAEKGGSSRSQPPNSPRNAADILTMHGINVDLTGQGQKCSTLKKTLDLKMEKLQVEQKNQTKFKDRLEKGRRSLSSATGEKVEKIKKSMINAQKLLDRTLKTLDVVKKEYATAQKEYDTELARTIPNSKRSNSKDTPPSMTFETLELQYQGFCIVETLIENDPSYINEHADIVRAFRWLWRSKGRHIRLLHEDSMPPRFNGESRVLARFLVNIAKTSNDVDILFDLLRIFLQPTSSDFSFVQNFLKETVCNSLTIDQKKRVMQRFYPVIGSEGIEELKVLSIQFLILPMLRKDFESLPTTQGKDNEGHNGKIEGLLDHELTDTFMAEVLLKGVKSRSYGSRLNVELLKLTSLLLNFKGNLIHNQHRDEMIKFIWNLLSSDDIKTKQWACVSVCHFIEVFPVPPINVLQLYATLLRLNNQEARDLTYFALDLLFPVMSGRFSSDSCSKVVQYTIKILYEEGNSLSSLSHVWQIIVNHERMFYYHRDHIITHLISGLNKIGLPPNSPVESRKLSILMIQMLFKWESRKSEKFAGLESKSDIVDKDHLQIFSELQCPESSPSKKIQRLPELQIDKSDSSLPFSLQKAELESIVNFLLRMTFLAATTDKPDQQVVVQEANSLFRKIVKRYPEVQVRDTYFDRVELICIEEYKEMSVANSKKTQQVEQGQPTTTRLTDTSQSSMKKEDTTKIVSNNLLSTCLDIFTIIQQSTPRNNFLVHNEEKCIHILLVCLHHTRDSKQSQLREKVKKYLQALFQNEDTNRHTKETCKTYFESTFIEYALSLSRKLKSKESKSKDEESTMHDAVLFCLDEVEKISARMSNFPDLLVKSLISVADKLSKSMLSMSSSRRIAANSKTPTVSPMVEVFNEAFLVNDTTKSTSSRKSEDIASKSLDGSIEVKCLISCLRLIGRSSVPNHFTNQRQKLMTILHDILEYSTNIKLLLTVTVLIGTWVTTERNVLTLTEMKQFILKLTALEQHGLPEVESQPLFHAVSLVVLTVHPKLQTKDIHATSKRAENTKIEKSIDQSLIACLLVTNKRLRAMVVYSFVSSLFCLPIDNSNITEENINAFSFGSHSPVALMEKLVCTSFESLGHRLWTLVFVDILLLSSKPSQTSSSVSGSNKTSERYITGQIKCESYKNFRCLVKAADDGRLIHAIRILASCDTNLNQNLLDVLMSKAWSLCTENSLRLKMVSFMDKLLICPAQAQLLSNSTNASINTPEKRFQYRDINSIQMMLRAIGKMIPTPMLSIDTLLFLAKNYNCWHEVRR